MEVKCIILTIIFSIALFIGAFLLLESTSILQRMEPLLMQATECKQKLVDPPNGFRKIGSKFYYIENKVQMNWFAAAHRCQALGGHLVSLQSKQEYDDLKAQLNINRNYWIDINDLSKEGQFLSLTTGREPTYLNWEPYTENPNNFQNKEHCGGLWNHRSNLLMNDFACVDLMNFVCESYSQ